MTPELQAYLLWLNKGNPPASQGDAFLGGPVGLPSPFPPYFDVTSPVFGAKGDSNLATDDSVAIQAAIDAAYNSSGNNSTIVVFIPAAPVQSNGTQGFYNCKSALSLHPGTHIMGSSKYLTRLNFPSDTDGISGDDVELCQLERLYLTGNGPASAVSTATAGIRCLASTRWTLRDIFVTEFVDQFVFDATGDTNALHELSNCWTSNLGYPNATNGYPRYGVHVTGSGHTVQALHMGSGSTISGSQNADNLFETGDGTTTTWGFPALKKALWREAGVTVYYVANNELTKLTSGTDYNVYDFTTGSNVLITTGSSGTKTTNINIIFKTAPVNGQNLRIVVSDPYMLVGLYIQNGTGNTFNLTQVQGCQYCVIDATGFNDVYVANAEQTDVVFAPAAASYSRMRIGNIEQITTDQLYSNQGLGSTGNSFITSDSGAGWGWTRVRGTGTGVGTQTFTSGSNTVVATDGDATGVLSWAEFGMGQRDINVQFLAALTNSSGGDASALFTLQLSNDLGGSWTNQLEWKVSGYTSASSVFFVPVNQSAQDTSDMPLPVGGYATTVQYRVVVALLTGTHVQVIANDDVTTYTLQVRNVNRPGD